MRRARLPTRTTPQQPRPCELGITLDRLPEPPSDIAHSLPLETGSSSDNDNALSLDQHLRCVVFT